MKKIPTSTSNAVFVTVTRGMDERASRREPPQALVDAREDLVLDPARVRGLLVQARRADRLLDLVDRRRDDEPEEERDRAGEREVVDEDADAAAERAPRRCSQSTPGRIAAAMMNPRKSRAMTTLIFQSASASTTMRARDERDDGGAFGCRCP